MCENCTDIAVFSNGEVVYQGKPTEVFKNAEEIKNLRLDVPVTGYLVDELKKIGVEIDCDFTRKDFVEKVANLYKNGK